MRELQGNVFKLGVEDLHLILPSIEQFAREENWAYEEQWFLEHMEEQMEMGYIRVIAYIRDEEVMGVLIFFLTEDIFSPTLRALEIVFWVREDKRGSAVSGRLAGVYESICRKEKVDSSIFGTVFHRKNTLKASLLKRGYKPLEERLIKQF